MVDSKTVLYTSMIFPEKDPSIIDHHRKTPFPDEGGEKDTNPDPDITQCAKFLSTVALRLL